jgi:hypothetical protein
MDHIAIREGYLENIFIIFLLFLRYILNNKRY